MHTACFEVLFSLRFAARQRQMPLNEQQRLDAMYAERQSRPTCTAWKMAGHASCSFASKWATAAFLAVMVSRSSPQLYSRTVVCKHQE